MQNEIPDLAGHLTKQGEQLQGITGTVVKKKTSMFTVLTANQWSEKAKTTPTPNRLLNELWHEGEICILFADTNTGKSILGVNVAEHISGGTQLEGFIRTPAQPVLYLDFELSEKQREIRYSQQNEKNECFNHYSFSPNLHFAQVDPDQLPPPEFEKAGFEVWLKHSIEAEIINTGIKVLIVDNITYLSSEQEKARDALPLMKGLKELKNKYGLSILCLAHTPKRDATKPITRNDLQGSKMLINFCDSAFAIGESTAGKSIRYIKQIKERNTPKIYDTDNIILFEIIKYSNYLYFHLLEFGGKESEHLKVYANGSKTELEAEVMKLHGAGIGQNEIARQLGINAMRVSRIVNKQSKAA